MRNQYLIETLREIRFLHDVPAEHLELLSKVAQLCEFDAGQTIFPEGAVADSVYFVVSGKVSLEICAPAVGSKPILEVGPGDILGCSGLLSGARLTSTARALTQARLMRLDSVKLLATCAANPQFGFEFSRRTMAALARRLNSACDELAQLCTTQDAPPVGGNSLDSPRPR